MTSDIGVAAGSNCRNLPLIVFAWLVATLLSKSVVIMPLKVVLDRQISNDDF